MYEEKIVLCGANSYEEKYYLNPDFSGLPDHIKDELKILFVPLKLFDLELTSNLVKHRIKFLRRHFNYTIRCSSWERNCRRKICY